MLKLKSYLIAGILGLTSLTNVGYGHLNNEEVDAIEFQELQNAINSLNRAMITVKTYNHIYGRQQVNAPKIKMIENKLEGMINVIRLLKNPDAFKDFGYTLNPEDALDVWKKRYHASPIEALLTSILKYFQAVHTGALDIYKEIPRPFPTYEEVLDSVMDALNVFGKCYLQLIRS